MGFLKTTNSIVKKFDILGRKPSLLINESSRFKTTLGGLLSIVIYMLLILSFLNFGQELYFLKNPNVIMSKVYNNEEEGVSLNNDTFSFMITLTDINNNYITDSNLISFEGSITRDIYSGITQDYFKQTNDIQDFTQCDEEYLTHSFKDVDNYYLYQRKVNKGFCLSNVKNDIIISKNINKEQNYSAHKLKLKLNFNICKTELEKQANLTAVKKCYDSTYMESMLNNAKVEILYLDTMMDESVYDTPNKNVLKKYEIYLSPKLTKYITMSCMRNKIKTDKGYILEDYHTTEYLGIDFIRESLTFDEGNKVLDISIELSNIQSIMKRRYLKAQRLIAEVGGIMKAFMLMAFCMQYLHNKTRFYEKMIGNIFDIPDLNKYYQFYNDKNKHLYRKYRDSIALRRTFDLNNVVRKADRSNTTSTPFVPMNNFLIDLAGGGGKKLLNNLVNSTNLNLESENKKMEILELEDEHEHDHDHDPGNANRSISEPNNSEEQVNTNTVINNNLIRNNYSVPVQTNQNLLTNQLNTNNHSALTQHFDNLKKNKDNKTIFEKVKNDKFRLTLCEAFRVNCCCKNIELKKKRKILNAGKYLIDGRLDTVTLLKKFLDFDRFKNLVLKDYQVVLLNSLSRFLLDPETVNLVDFNNISYEKLVDALMNASSTNSVIDHNLKDLVKSKFQI